MSCTQHEGTENKEQGERLACSSLGSVREAAVLNQKPLITVTGTARASAAAGAANRSG